MWKHDSCRKTVLSPNSPRGEKWWKKDQVEWSKRITDKVFSDYICRYLTRIGRSVGEVFLLSAEQQSNLHNVLRLDIYIAYSWLFFHSAYCTLKSGRPVWSRSIMQIKCTANFIIIIQFLRRNKIRKTGILRKKFLTDVYYIQFPTTRFNWIQVEILWDSKLFCSEAGFQSNLFVTSLWVSIFKITLLYDQYRRTSAWIFS